MARKLNKLTTEQKLLILQRLACFDTPLSIIKELKQEYDIDVTAQSLQAYDPDKVNGKNLSPKFVEFFNETRKRFREDFTSIPIANKAYRLAMLDRMARAASDKGNIAMTTQMLEQAAKEVGDVYTNQQKVKVSGGTANTVTNINPEEYREIRKQMLAEDGC